MPDSHSLSSRPENAGGPDSALNRPIAAIMTAEVAQVGSGAMLGDAVAQMVGKRISSVLVVEGNRPLGIVTERDLLRVMRDGLPHDTPVARVMSTPLLTVHRSLDCLEAYQFMARNRMRHLVVVDDAGRLQGVVSETDFRRQLGLTQLARFDNAASVMTHEILHLPPDAHLAEAVAAMERQRASCCIVVVEDNRPVGIVTERDVARLYARHADPDRLPLKDVMSSPVLAVTADTPVSQVALKMLESRIRHLAVTDDAGRMVGLIDEHSLLHLTHIKLVDELIRKSGQASDLLQVRKAQLRATLENSPHVAVQWYDPAGRVIYWNKASEAFYGWTAEEAVGRMPDETIFTPEDFAGFRGVLDKIARSGCWVGPDEYHCRHRDGSIRTVLATVYAIPGEGGEPCFVCMDVDITARKAAEESLRLNAIVFEQAQEGIVITDADGFILDVNRAYSELTGYPREEVVGRHADHTKTDWQDEALYDDMWRVLRRDGRWRGEVWARRTDGTPFAGEMTASAVRDAAGRVSHFIGVFTDITQAKENERRLERMAHYDALTRLPNRVLLADRLQQSIARAERTGDMVAVVYLDLDDFKPVNDALGPAAGDRLLLVVAERLKDCVRGGDTVARLGGDEFALLLCDLEDQAHCERILTRTLSVLSQPVHLEGREAAVTASLGVTLHPLDQASPEHLLRHADQSMCQAKQSGRNRYHFYDPEQDQRAHARSEALARLEQALENREFVLHYQPKVDMRRGWVIGAEALIRWRHPERGLLPPAEFLPLIEDSDFAAAVDEWVMEEALRQMREWAAAGVVLEVSVNISSRCLQRADFLQCLTERLARYPEVPARRLQLEILETAALADIHHVARLIEQCGGIGVSFSLDDFGTGYSSLTYLKRLPTSGLKIDQSFVRDMLKDAEDRAIVQGVIGLAQAFSRQVIAEGVESAEHGLHLLQLGCDLAQGYGIARPMPAGILPAWIKAYQSPADWSESAVPVPRV